MIDVDAAKLPVMLTTLRLPTISRIWQEFGGRADREGWGSARFLAALCEHELADRQARRIARHMAESGLPQGKSFATFDFAAVPTIRKAHVMALAEGDAWLEQGANILLFGPTESDSYYSSLHLLRSPALFVADCQTADAGVGGPVLPA